MQLIAFALSRNPRLLLACFVVPLQLKVRFQGRHIFHAPSTLAAGKLVFEQRLIITCLELGFLERNLNDRGATAQLLKMRTISK